MEIFCVNCIYVDAIGPQNKAMAKSETERPEREREREIRCKCEEH